MKRYSVLVAALLLVSLAHGKDWLAFRIYASNARQIDRIVNSDLTLLQEDVAWTTDVAVQDEADVRRLGLPYTFLRNMGDFSDQYENLADGTNYQTEYLSYANILAQYEEWRTAYPSLVTRQQIGSSIENRPIYVYTLKNPGSALPQQGVFLQGGIHAREWISPPTVMYIFDTMLKEALSSASGWNLLSRYELMVVPVVNPDGYEYSRSSSNNRLWRKNRRDNPGSSFGVDLNRNYPVGWGGPGSSGTPSNSTYRGTAAWSEPEVSCIRDFLNVRTQTIGLPFVIDYHSHGQKMLYPWSYTENPAPHGPRMLALSNVYAAALQAETGRVYDTGQGSVALYIAGGTSKDYFYDAFGSDSYTVEMRAGGQSGFELPPAEILPNCRENYAGFKAALIDLL